MPGLVLLVSTWICYRNRFVGNRFGTTFAASLEPLCYLFYRYYFGGCSSELAELVPLPYSHVRSTRCSDRLLDFSVTVPRCYMDVYVNSFFPCTTR